LKKIEQVNGNKPRRNASRQGRPFAESGASVPEWVDLVAEQCAGSDGLIPCARSYRRDALNARGAKETQAAERGKQQFAFAGQPSTPLVQNAIRVQQSQGIARRHDHHALRGRQRRAIRRLAAIRSAAWRKRIVGAVALRVVQTAAIGVCQIIAATRLSRGGKAGTECRARQDSQWHASKRILWPMGPHR
jgi:hypothetical protein